MRPTDEQREELLEAADENVRFLYTSEETGVRLREIFNEMEMPEQKYRDYALAVGDIMLGFYPKSQIAFLLEVALEIPRNQSKLFAEKLNPLLEKIPEKRGVLTLPEPEQGSVEASPAPIASAQSEKTNPTTLEQLRTMQKDADRVHGYGAYRQKYPTPEQARADQKSSNSVSDLPKYTPE